MYTVVYEDGDKEDFNPQECEKVVTLSDDIKSGRVKEWEVGGDRLVDSIYVSAYSLLGLFYQQSTKFFKMGQKFYEKFAADYIIEFKKLNVANL